MRQLNARKLSAAFFTSYMQLTYVGINARNRTHLYASTPKRCRDCSQKPQSTRGKIRILQIHIYEGARQRARERAKTPEFDIARRARKKVEALFAELKNQIGLADCVDAA